MMTHTSSLDRGVFFSPDDDAVPGGASMEQTEIDTDVSEDSDSEDSGDQDDRIREAVSKETAALRRKRDEVLSEKKALRKQLDEMRDVLDTLGGEEGARTLVEMRERLAKDELGSLLADGNHEEWFDRRAASMRKDYERQIGLLEEHVSSIQSERDKARDAFIRVKRDTAIVAACAELDVEPSAYPDVLLRAERAAEYDEELGILVFRDSDGEISYGKDGKKPKTPNEWLSDQREVARHWWGPSQGTNATGRGGRAGRGLGPESTDLTAAAKLSPAEYREARARAGFGNSYSNAVPD